MRIPLSLLAVLASASSAGAEFSYITSYSTWQSIVPSYTTVDLVDLNAGDWLTDQYASLGVIFDGGFIEESPDSFVQDGHGVWGGCFVTMTLATPAFAVGSHHPGAMRFDLYQGDTLLYTSIATGSGYNNFRGVVSTVPFDRVVLRGITLGPPSCDGISVDNFYFASVPAPGVGGPFLIGMLANRLRRRT
jgi:hypothetical protein